MLKDWETSMDWLNHLITLMTFLANICITNLANSEHIWSICAKHSSKKRFEKKYILLTLVFVYTFFYNETNYLPKKVIQQCYLKNNIKKVQQFTECILKYKFNCKIEV